MTGCGDCRLSDGHCPHTGRRCGGFDERDLAVDTSHEHRARPGPRIERYGLYTSGPEYVTDICRCGAYRLWHLTKPGQWRPGPVPSRQW